MVVLGRRAPAPDPAVTPLRMEAVPSRACAADRGGWACGFGRQAVPTGGFPGRPGQARRGHRPDVRWLSGWWLPRSTALRGLCAAFRCSSWREGACVRDRSAASVGGALRPPRPRRVPCSRRSAGSGRTGRRPALVGPFLLHASERTLFLCLTGGRHRFIAWARSATEGGSPAAARAGRGGGALAGGGTARGRAPRGARQPDVRGTVACVPRRPPSEPWTPRALPFNVTEGSFLLKNVFCCFFSDI